MARRMKPQNSGTVQAISPCDGLCTLPLLMRLARAGPRVVVYTPNVPAISALRYGPGPSSAIARRYFFSPGVGRSQRKRKKLSSSRCETSALVSRMTGAPMGEAWAWFQAW